MDPYAQFTRFSDGAGNLDLEEFIDAKDVVMSLSKEYEACEHADYVSPSTSDPNYALPIRVCCARTGTTVWQRNDQRRNADMVAWLGKQSSAYAGVLKWWHSFIVNHAPLSLSWVRHNSSVQQCLQQLQLTAPNAHSQFGCLLMQMPSTTAVHISCR